MFTFSHKNQKFQKQRLIMTFGFVTLLSNIKRFGIFNEYIQILRYMYVLNISIFTAEKLRKFCSIKQGSFLVGNTIIIKKTTMVLWLQ